MTRHLVRAGFAVLTRLRYRVEIEGFEQLKNLEGPALVLPNHPAYIDPMLILTRLPGELGLRPLVSSTMYRFVALRWIFRAVRALKIPSAQEPGTDPEKRLKEAFGEVVKGLGVGEKFLIYPSGHIEHDGLEHLASARAVSEILRQRPGTPLVLVRTTQLWGSISSFAMTGNSPRLSSCFLRAAGIILANLIFFTPRRRVKIKIEIVDPKTLPGPEREKLNPWLEAWYNHGLSARPVYVPYHFLFASRTHTFPTLGDKAKSGAADPETRKIVIAVLEEALQRKLLDDDSKPETRLDALGLDSLAEIDLRLSLEQRVGHAVGDMPATLGELEYAVENGGKDAHGTKKPLKAVPGWDGKQTGAHPAAEGPQVAVDGADTN